MRTTTTVRLGGVLLLAGIAALLLGGKGGGYNVEIRTTTYGIPHIKADDYPSVSYGAGYAFARDNICVLAEEINKVNGERAMHFGESSSHVNRGNSTVVNNLKSDFFMKLVMDETFLTDWLNSSRKKIRQGIEGYAAGYNRYLADTGLANLPDACKNEAWVRPITSLDLMKRFYQLILLASQGFFITGMVDVAEPPVGGPGNPFTTVEEVLALLEDDPCIVPNPDDPECPSIGSNAYAFGSQATGTPHGMLLGNPHFPWLGTERFHTMHLTVPGDLDIYGMALYGVPLVLIGFNEGIAWSHTVSTAYRFTPVELKLVPGDPTSYIIDGQNEAMTTRDVEVCVAETGGNCTDLRTHTFFYSRYGPLFELLVSGQPLFGWDNARAYSLRDANAVNLRTLDHFWDINRADDIEDVKEILEEHVAIPWVNTIAADSQGNAFYADIGVVPNVTDDLATQCNTFPVGVGVFQLLGLPVLDGSRTDCEWVEDPDAAQVGAIPGEDMPRLERLDYTMNSNDSYWLSHHEHPLEGYPRIIGDEQTERTLRTRLGYRQVIDRLSGLFTDAFQAADGMPGTDVTIEKLQAMLYGNSTYPNLGNRNLTAELVRDDLVQVCLLPTPMGIASDGTPIDLTQACAVLAAWDLRHDVDSVGAHVFQEWWRRRPADTLWLTPFDVNDPVNTPRDLNVSDPQVKQALVDGVHALNELNMALDAELGDVQYVVRNGDQIPIHGGPGSLGVFNALNNSLIEKPNGDGYYDIFHGSSYIQTVTWDSNGPVAEMILTYSQSSHSDSPHYRDQTDLYSGKGWLDIPFHEADILADPNYSTITLTEP